MDGNVVGAVFNNVSSERTNDSFVGIVSLDGGLFLVFADANEWSSGAGTTVVGEFFDAVVVGRADFVEVIESVAPCATSAKANVPYGIAVWHIDGSLGATFFFLPTCDEVREGVLACHSVSEGVFEKISQRVIAVVLVVLDVGEPSGNGGAGGDEDGRWENKDEKEQTASEHESDLHSVVSK